MEFVFIRNLNYRPKKLPFTSFTTVFENLDDEFQTARSSYFAI